MICLNKIKSLMAIVIIGFVLSAQAASPSQTVFHLDIDGNGEQNPLSDGLLILRYLFGFRGDALVSQAIGSGATRTTATEIESYLSGHLDDLDIDGSGTIKPLSDGLLLLRYFFGFSGSSLIDNAVANDATRKTAIDIEKYIQKIISKQIVAMNGIEGLTLLVGNGVDYLGVSNDGEFEADTKGKVFTVYNGITKEPIYFSYATDQDLLVDHRSTALFLATRYFDPIKKADPELIAKYNELVDDIPELKLLSEKIKQSVVTNKRIDMNFIDSELAGAIKVFQNKYEEGIFLEHNNAGVVKKDSSLNMLYGDVVTSGSTTYPRFRGIRLEEAKYEKNNDGTYTVDLTVRNGNPAYLGMTTGRVKYLNGKYSVLGSNAEPYNLINAGNTSNFYKSFTSISGLVQSTIDIASTVNLINEHGIVGGLSNSTLGESITNISGLNLSCRENAVVFSANDNMTVLINYITQFSEAIQLFQKFDKAYRGPQQLSLFFDRKKLVVDTAKGILLNKKFLKKGLIFIENKDYSGYLKHFISIESFKDIYLKELLVAIQKQGRISSSESEVILASALTAYDVKVSGNYGVVVLSDFLIEKAFKQILKKLGIAGVGLGIDVTKAVLDAWSFNYFVSTSYEAFIQPLDFIDCGENPNEAKITEVLPKKAPYGKEVTINFSGYNLDKSTRISFDNCSTSQLTISTEDSKSGIILCIPIPNKNNKTKISLETNGKRFDIGEIRFYSFSPSINSVTHSYSPKLDEKSKFFINGSNLQDVSIFIEGCFKLDLLLKEKYKNIYSCSGFSSSGVKNIIIKDSANNKIHETGVFVGESIKPRIFSANKLSIPNGKSSEIIISGDNLFTNNKNAISYEIIGCSNTPVPTIDLRSFSFNCFPNNDAEKVAIDFYEEDHLSGEFITTRTVDVKRKVELPSKPLTIMTTNVSAALSCTQINARLSGFGGVPPYKWHKVVNPSHQFSPVIPFQESKREGIILSISANGNISGQVEQNAWKKNYSFEVVLEDSTGTTVRKQFPLRIINSGEQCTFAQDLSGIHF